MLPFGPGAYPGRFKRKGESTYFVPTLASKFQSLWVADRVRVITTGLGTSQGGFQFDGGASAGFRDFVTAGAPDGVYFGYVIEQGNDWETGVAIYHASDNSMVSVVIDASSNNNGPVNFGGGSKLVSLALLARQASTPLWQATGGVITQIGGNQIHTFLANSVFQVLSGTRTVKLLVVAGGGAGGGINGTSVAGGGGGGGGVIETSLVLSPGNYQIIIGAGAPGAVAPGANGGDSSFNVTIDAVGGGGGGSTGANRPGASGGSGGGGGQPNAATNGGAGTVGQGNNGGSCLGNNNDSGGGGGGGGGVGANGGPVATPGNGGAGYNSTISGNSAFYAGGGGGGNGTDSSTDVGAAGSGGGGKGASTATGNANATSGTGGGGGGNGGGTNRVGGSGGSGIVIISYAL